MSMFEPVALPRAKGVSMPPIGIGTWHMGEAASSRDTEIAGLRHAMEIGFRHFDTAEMYAEGGAEEVLGEAMAGRDRSGLFITSKFYPYHGAPADMRRALDHSLKRLKTDYLDLYLLHWPGSHPIEETIECGRQLVESGRIAAFGLSNFDTAKMKGLQERGLIDAVAANQIMFNIARRGVEHDLLPALDAMDVVPIAYTPLEPSRLKRIDGLAGLAGDLGLSLPQLAIAWHMTRRLAVPIPKSSQPEHLDALMEGAQTRLSDETLARIDELSPAPTKPTPLDII